MIKIYDAFELLLKTAVPQDCRIFHANMPLQLMDQLTRDTAKLCTWLLFQDRIHVNSSGGTSVHEIIIEISVFGTLDDVDSMARSITEVLVESVVTSGGWKFILTPDTAGKRDIWEPRIQVKREWLRLKGFAIEPESAVTGTAG